MNTAKALTLITIFLLVGCKNKKVEGTTPFINVVSSFSYTNRMMDRTLEGGKTYQIEKKNRYNANDIVVFNYNDMFLKKSIRVAYRVIGGPGDTVQIKNADIFVNRKRFLLPTSALYHYCVALKGLNAEMETAFNVQGQSGEIYDCFFTERDSFALAKKYREQIVFMRKCPLEYNFELLLNRQNQLGWDMDNFGPVIIPKLNSSVSMDSARLFFYKYHNSQKIGSVHIRQPYYFVVGDNFDDAASDSRSIGLIGYDQIEGALKL